jgi:hypothetical protein
MSTLETASTLPTPSADSTFEPPITSFSSPAGMRVSRAILRDKLQFDPHDYQLEGVCKLLDGVHVLGLIPTGGGETGFIFMSIILLQAARIDPRFHLDLRNRLPQNAAAVVVLPTNSVEMEMVRVFSARRLIHMLIGSKSQKFVDTYKIPSVVINADELEKAHAEGRDLGINLCAVYMFQTLGQACCHHRPIQISTAGRFRKRVAVYGRRLRLPQCRAASHQRFCPYRARTSYPHLLLTPDCRPPSGDRPLQDQSIRRLVCSWRLGCSWPAARQR